MSLNFRNLAVPPEPPINIQSVHLRKCKQVFARWMHFPDDAEVVDLFLGILAANHIPGATVWLMLVGPSAGGKTELVNTARLLPNIHFASHVTEAGLMCGKLNKDGLMELNGGLLHDVGAFGFILIPEFSGIMASDRRALPAILSILRQAYDGHAYREVGSEDGGRRLWWHGRCAVVAASAPGIDSRREVIAEMGERFVYYRLGYTDADRRLVNAKVGRNRNRKPQMREELAQAVRNVLLPVIDNPPTIELAQEEIDYLGLLADFAARCRTPVDRSGSWNKEAEGVHVHEMSARVSDELAGLLCGLLAVGVDYTRSWGILRRIVWDSIPNMRVAVLRYLITNTELGTYYAKGEKRMVQDLNLPPVPIRRAIEDLVYLGVVEPYIWRVSDESLSKRQGVRRRWRLAERTWTEYAVIENGPPEDPRRGLLGSAVVYTGKTDTQ